MVYQSSSDIQLQQPGSKDAGNASFLLGGKTGQPNMYDWRDLRHAWAGGGNPGYMAFWDDFLGDAIDTRLILTVEAGGNGTISASTPTELYGVAVVETSSSSPQANDYTDIASGLHWEADNGWIMFTGRVRGVSSNLTYISVEVGLGDAVSYTNGNAFSAHETAAALSGADAICFAFTENTTGDTTYWKALSANNGTVVIDETHASATLDATNWHKFDIILNEDGYAWMYVDDVLLTSYTAGEAIQPDVPLTPYIGVRNRTTAQRFVHFDYLGVVGSR